METCAPFFGREAMCPNCGSRNIQSNKISDEFIHRVADGTQAAQQAGLRTLALGGFAAVGVMGVINSCRKEWRCHDCGCRF